METKKNILTYEGLKKYEEEFAREGIKIVYFPYTQGVSSTLIAKTLEQVRDNPKSKIID